MLSFVDAQAPVREVAYSTGMTHAILAAAVALGAKNGSSEVERSVHRAAQSLVDTHRTAGVAYALVWNGKLVGSGFAGARDMSKNAPVTADTLFRIGSATKMFTALAIMQLVERGRLSLDGPLATFWPDFPNAASITIRDLLMHRSGIANYLDAAVADGRSQSPTTPVQIINEAMKFPPGAAPGTRFSYSNTNYVLLGLIVERISGIPLHAYYRKYIFRPAGMSETFAGTVPSRSPVATGYLLSDGGTAPQTPGDVSWYYGCGDALSTAADMARFDIALMDGRLVRASTLSAMTASAQPSDDLGRGTRYGLGFTIFPFGDLVSVGHHGGLPGFEADDEMIIKDRFAIVALGNDYKFPTGVLVYTALKTAYPAQAATAAAQAASEALAAAAKAAPLTNRFATFFASLLAGKVPADEMTDAFKGAMTASTVREIRQMFAANGTFERLQFVSDDEAEGYHRYHYTAVFSGGNQPLTFVLDSNGAIAGFFKT
jgi:CubicO group peptidase (beta-lactamase class C family)